MRSSLFASVDVMEFQTNEAYSTLDLTNAKMMMMIIIIIIIKFFITYLPSQQLQGQLQTEHGVDDDDDNDDNNNNNPILYYLCAEATATRPITDTAQCR
jgi:hypothetical protein